HAKDDGDSGRDCAPEKEADPLCLKTVDEVGTGGDADDGDEDVEPDGVHEPDRGRRYAPEGRPHGSQPAAHQASDERAAGGGERDRYAFDLEDNRTDQRADGDECADEGDVGDVSYLVGDAEHLGRGVGVLGAADDGEDVAALNFRVGQDGDLGGSCAAGDF